MNEQRILEELLELLKANSVAIRYEPLGGSGGGLCTVKGQQIFFVDTQAPSIVSAALCAEALPKVVDIETLYIRPQVRQFIENHSNQITLKAVNDEKQTDGDTCNLPGDGTELL